MARFKKMQIASSAPSEGTAGSDAVGSEVLPKAVLAAARDAVRDLPVPPASEGDRLARLLRQTVAAQTPEVARAAIEAAATLRCQVPFTTAEQDRKTVGHVARFLVWSAFGGVVDPKRAFTKANVDEHLAATATNSKRSAIQRRWVLYGVGRQLHPQQFPPGQSRNTPVRQRIR